MLVETNLSLSTAVYRTMQYFALFRYPLQAFEIRQYCGVPCTESEVQAALDEQVLKGNIFSLHGFYALEQNIAELLQRRFKGKEKAIQDLEIAKRVGRFIYRFPFVSFVGISGSLSKGYSDEDSDFDFFIITDRDRLWICRTILHLMKKLSFLVGQQHKLCMNYFIDESALTIQEKNIYTATELYSLIPVCGAEVHQRFLEANKWVERFLPNYSRPEPDVAADCRSLSNRAAGALLNLISPESFNRRLMKMTDSKWQRKWKRKGYPQEDYDQAFKTRINISKNHHLNYQKRVLSALRMKEE